MKGLLIGGFMLICSVGILNAQDSLDELLSKNIEARGGYAAIKSVSSLKMKGNMVLGPEVFAPLLIEMKRPENIRMEMTIQGETGIETYNGESGWRLFPFLGHSEAQQITAAELDDLRQKADLDGPLVDYEIKGHTLELLSREKTENKDSYRIKLSKKSGGEAIIFIDSETFLEFKQIDQASRLGSQITITTTIGEYKNVNGLMLPHYFEVKIGDQAGDAQSVRIESIELNVEITDNRFSKPE